MGLVTAVDVDDVVGVVAAAVLVVVAAVVESVGIVGAGCA